MRRWIIGTAGVLAMIAVVAIYWLFYDNRLPTSGSFPIDLAAIRAEAARMPGGGPVRIETETLSHVRVPKIAMVAGSDWSKIDVARIEPPAGLPRPLDRDRHSLRSGGVARVQRRQLRSCGLAAARAGHG